MQVAIEIGVEPEAGPDSAIGRGGRRRRLPASNHPARAARGGRGVDQRVSGEAAPGLEISADVGLAADDGQQITRAATAQRSNQLGQQTGRKSPPAGVDLDPRFHRHGSYYDVSVFPSDG
jgi:hypothetical protein